MATLHVRNVPDQLHKQLRKRAEADNRSLSAEVITLLSNAVGEQTEQTNVAELLEEIRRHRYTPPKGSPDTTTLLREDRQR